MAISSVVKRSYLDMCWLRAGRLPMVHEDPFDRLLIAQAQAHHLVVVTRSDWIPQYDVAVMRV